MSLIRPVLTGLFMVLVAACIDPSLNTPLSQSPITVATEGRPRSVDYKAQDIMLKQFEITGKDPLRARCRDATHYTTPMQIETCVWDLYVAEVVPLLSH